MTNQRGGIHPRRAEADVPVGAHEELRGARDAEALAELERVERMNTQTTSLILAGIRTPTWLTKVHSKQSNRVCKTLSE